MQLFFKHFYIVSILSTATSIPPHSQRISQGPRYKLVKLLIGLREFGTSSQTQSFNKGAIELEQVSVGGQEGEADDRH